jgi:hypothetical protein
VGSTSHSLNGRKFGRAMPEQTWATEICWAVSNLKKTENGMALVIFGTWYLFSQGKGNKNHFSTLHTESSYKNTTTTPSHASVVRKFQLQVSRFKSRT